MYLACKDLVTSSGHVKSGEEIKDADTWSYPVIIAHLNLGWIKWVADKKSAAPKSEPIADTSPQKVQVPESDSASNLEVAEEALVQDEEKKSKKNKKGHAKTRDK